MEALSFDGPTDWPLLYLIGCAVYIAVGVLFQKAHRPSKPFLCAFKSLPILGLAYLTATTAEDPLGLILALAYIASASGDVALCMDRRSDSIGFQFGILSFLFAHVFFTAAAVMDGNGVTLTPWNYVDTYQGQARLVQSSLLVVYFAIVSRWIIPRVGASLQGPVVAYMGSLAAMSLTAMLRVDHDPLIAAGAMLFVFSDTLIAVDQFVDRKALAHSELFTMIGYYSGQFLMAYGWLR
eukprot:TRINITY_DN1279_c0_g1_i1.p1 TRINITY_DN1279_c0_g1~~TRINITY_DN1279_c0_g1_i1.p1  ORF type:complete len:272 (+),score=41.69 TRINITY_DN1279_c0_g1_i1:105-818(+)